MIEHPPFATLAARSIDGWLDQDERIEFSAHLGSCVACRALLVGLRADQARLAAIEPIQTSPALRRNVLAATHRRTRPSAWLLVAAALLVLAATVGALAVGAYLSRSFDRQVIELSVDWQAIPAVDLAAGATTSRIRAVVAGPGGFVAVGSAGGKAAVWTSKDGVTWPRSPDLPDGAGAELVALELGGPGFVAAGRSGVGGAIWTSPDGIAWTPVRPADAFPQAVINVLRRSDDGWIAAGAAFGAAGLTGATWISIDGVTWQGRIPSAGVSSGADYMPSLTSIFRRPDGVWVAHRLGDDVPFSSSDGRTWVRMSSAIPGLTGVRGVRQIEGGMVAVNGTGASWSIDGVTWSTSTMTPAVEGSLDGIEVETEGFIAFGTGSTGSFVYRSRDGRTFLRDQALIGEGGGTVYDVATSAEVDVAVGIEDGTGAVWSRIR